VSGIVCAVERTCAWCGGPLPADARASRETCSARCRQARRRADGLGRPVRVCVWCDADAVWWAGSRVTTPGGLSFWHERPTCTTHVGRELAACDKHARIRVRRMR